MLRGNRGALPSLARQIAVVKATLLQSKKAETSDEDTHAHHQEVRKPASLRH